MNDMPSEVRDQAIIVDEVFPHAPATLWKALTSAELMARWLGMAPTGFAPEVGTRFTYQTTPAGEWDGTIRCEVLEVIPTERLSYSWRGGHEANVGYGSPLDTIVTFTLAEVEGGTQVRVVHAGFVLPKNESAYRVMGNGWTKVVARIGAMAGEAATP